MSRAEVRPGALASQEPGRVAPVARPAEAQDSLVVRMLGQPLELAEAAQAAAAEEAAVRWVAEALVALSAPEVEALTPRVEPGGLEPEPAGRPWLEPGVAAPPVRRAAVEERATPCSSTPRPAPCATAPRERASP